VKPFGSATRSPARPRPSPTSTSPEVVPGLNIVIRRESNRANGPPDCFENPRRPAASLEAGGLARRHCSATAGGPRMHRIGSGRRAEQRQDRSYSGFTEKTVAQMAWPLAARSTRASLDDHHRSGRPRSIPVEVRCELMMMACDRPPRSPTGHLDVCLAERAPDRSTGWTASARARSARILRAEDFRPHRMRLWLPAPTPIFAKVRVICQLYTQPRSAPTCVHRREKPACRLSSASILAADRLPGRAGARIRVRPARHARPARRLRCEDGRVFGHAVRGARPKISASSWMRSPRTIDRRRVRDLDNLNIHHGEAWRTSTSAMGAISRRLHALARLVGQPELCRRFHDAVERCRRITQPSQAGSLRFTRGVALDENKPPVRPGCWFRPQRMPSYGGFAQDTWRARSSLTITMGMRLEKQARLKPQRNLLARRLEGLTAFRYPETFSTAHLTPGSTQTSSRWVRYIYTIAVACAWRVGGLSRASLTHSATAMMRHLSGRFSGKLHSELRAAGLRDLHA